MKPYLVPSSSLVSENTGGAMTSGHGWGTLGGRPGVRLVSCQGPLVGRVFVRIFGAFLWSGKSLKECSLSGLYCLYLEGKTDKEGLDHCFSHESVTESINLCGGSGTDFPAATRARALRHPGGFQIGVHGRQRNEVAYCTRTGSAGLSPTRYLSKAQNINS